MHADNIRNISVSRSQQHHSHELWARQMVFYFLPPDLDGLPPELDVLPPELTPLHPDLAQQSLRAELPPLVLTQLDQPRQRSRDRDRLRNLILTICRQQAYGAPELMAEGRQA